MVLRTQHYLSLGLVLLTFDPAAACMLNETQKMVMRDGLCAQGDALAKVPGCTSLLMKQQVGDQFKQIALARRCGFTAEADKLETFYKQTTPIIVDLYSCVDEPVVQADVEASAKAETDKNLSALAPGCPNDLKDKMEKRLPKLITIDEQSLRSAKMIASQIGLQQK